MEVIINIQYDFRSREMVVDGNNETVYLDLIELVHPVYRDADFTIDLS